MRASTQQVRRKGGAGHRRVKRRNTLQSAARQAPIRKELLQVRTLPGGRRAKYPPQEAGHLRWRQAQSRGEYTVRIKLAIPRKRTISRGRQAQSRGVNTHPLLAGVRPSGIEEPSASQDAARSGRGGRHLHRGEVPEQTETGRPRYQREPAGSQGRASQPTHPLLAGVRPSGSKRAPPRVHCIARVTTSTTPSVKSKSQTSRIARVTTSTTPGVKNKSQTALAR